VGTPFASTAHYSLLAALAQNQLSASDVRLVDLQPQAILAAWERGDIDAACTWLPTLDDPDAAAKAIAAEIGLKPEDVAGQLPRDCPVPSRSDERAVRGGVRIHNVEHRYGSGRTKSPHWVRLTSTSNRGHSWSSSGPLAAARARCCG
jgi:hypothetical protein